MEWEEQGVWFTMAQSSAKEADGPSQGHTAFSHCDEAGVLPPWLPAPSISKEESLSFLLHERLGESGNLPRDLVCLANSHSPVSRG